MLGCITKVHFLQSMLVSAISLYFVTSNNNSHIFNYTVLSLHTHTPVDSIHCNSPDKCNFLSTQKTEAQLFLYISFQFTIFGHTIILPNFVNG